MRLPIEKHLEYERIILRKWLRFLEPSELCIVMFVFDHTVGWSKPTERIRAAWFLEHLPISEKTLTRKLASLEQRGVLLVTRTPGQSNHYALDFEWQPPHKDTMRMPKHPKSVESRRGFKMPRKSKNDAEPSPKMGGTPSPKMGGTQYTRDKPYKEQTNSGKPLPLSARESVQRALRKTEEARERKMATAEKKGSTAALFTLWQFKCRKFFDGMTVLPWRVEERGMVATLNRKLKAAGGVSAAELIRWSVENWKAIVALEFGWMKSPPAPFTPEVRFLVKWVDRFVDRHNRGLASGKQKLAVPDDADDMEVAVTRKGALANRKRELARLDREIAKKQKAVQAVSQVTQEAVQKRLARFVNTKVAKPSNSSGLDKGESSGKGISSKYTWKD